MAAGNQYVNVSISDLELRQFVVPGACVKGKELGRGAYGTVEEYDVGGVPCAGKRIYDVLVQSWAGDIAHRYVEECTLMTKLRHPNVVQFLGVCFPQEAALPVLIMERLTTDLDRLLENTTQHPSQYQNVLPDRCGTRPGLPPWPQTSHHPQRSVCPKYPSKLKPGSKNQ